MLTTAAVPFDGIVHLTCADVSVLLDLRGGLLPAVVHWGGGLGDLDATQARAVADAAVPTAGPNAVDDPVRLALLPESGTGFMGRPGLRGSRGGVGWATRFHTTGATVDGRPVHTWYQGGPARLVVTARDDETRLGLELTVELLASGLLRTRAALTNEGEPFALDDLVLALPVPAVATELLDLAGRWGRERVPQRSTFTVGSHLREGRKGRTGADAATVLHAGTAGFGFGGGEVWAIHTAWSGNHVHYAELTFEGHRVLGGGELLLPGEVVLDRDETYVGPWLYAAYGHGLDAVAHRFHRYLRSRGTHVGPERPVTLNVWEAVYFDHDEGRLLDLADRAAALGIERFVLDDGWFGSRRDDTSGLGDWVVSPEVWPAGLHALVDRVTGLGMQFGLWFEPEMVSPDSDVARAHPEWVLSARSQWPVESRHQQVLNLAIPGAYAHVKDQMLALLDEYAIAYIKWDHNRDLVEAGDQEHGGRPGVHAQTAAFYRLLAELKAAHPGLEIESCSSGGGRVDLGVLEYADRVWVSDCIDPLERQQMLRWTAQLIPPEMMGSHVASGRSHTTGRTHDLNFRAATAVFGHLGVEWDLAQMSGRALAELGDWIAFFKEYRGLLLAGDIVRVDEPGDGLMVHGVTAADRSRALYAVVVVASPLADPPDRVRLPGLDPGRLYRLAPVLVGTAPSGLLPSPWWGGAATGPREPLDPSHPYLSLQRASSFPGADFTGRVLAAVGVRPPRVHPDQVVLFRAEAHTASTHPQQPGATAP